MNFGSIYEDGMEAREAREDFFRMRLGAFLNTQLVG